MRPTKVIIFGSSEAEILVGGYSQSNCPHFTKLSSSTGTAIYYILEYNTIFRYALYEVSGASTFVTSPNSYYHYCIDHTTQPKFYFFSFNKQSPP